MNKKRYILRKYVFAESLVDAIQLDAKTRVEDAWLDGDFKPEEKQSQIGFQIPESDFYYSPVLKPKKNKK